MNAEQSFCRIGSLRMAITAAQHGEASLVATVRNSGHGIAEGWLSDIRESFHSATEVGRGTDVGRAVHDGIAEDHGERLAAASLPDSGALFSAELPCGPPA